MELVDEFLAKHCRVEKKSWKRDETIARTLKAHFGKTVIGRIRPYGILAWRAKRATAFTKIGIPITKAALNREPSFPHTHLYTCDCDGHEKGGDPEPQMEGR